MDVNSGSDDDELLKDYWEDRNADDDRYNENEESDDEDGKERQEEDIAADREREREEGGENEGEDEEEEEDEGELLNILVRNILDPAPIWRTGCAWKVK